jgi:hypothetical protein
VAGAARSIDRNRLLRERIQATASRRGVPVAFPLLDTEDLQNVSFTDIWGGFDDIRRIRFLLDGSAQTPCTGIDGHTISVALDRIGAVNLRML